MPTVNLGRVGIVNKGAYVGGTTVHKVNDIITYGNSVYICVQGHSTEHLPTDTNYWTVWIDSTNLVHKDSAETITGVKTFSTQPLGITKGSVELGNVDNTSDANKPISTPQAAGLVAKTSATGSMYVPTGTTAERVAFEGAMRFNEDTTKFEGYNGSAWSSVGGGATGGGSDEVFIENSYTITADYTIPAGKSAVTVGDASGNVTINSGVTVTLESDSRWVVL